MGLTLVKDSGLILAGQLEERTNTFIEELIISTEAKTECQCCQTDSWGGYGIVLAPEVKQQVSKAGTQRYFAHQRYPPTTDR
jgi:hypothetical protein